MKALTVAPGELPYFPRPELLERAFKAFQAGQNVALFAPRRQGKTWFVRFELLPAARDAWGWRTLYIDLWAQRDQPELALLDGLEGALAKPPRFVLKELSASGKAGPLAATATWVRESDGAALSLEQRLRAALDELVAAGPLLIALDEFQTLAGAQRESFVAALRAGLQAHADRLRVFFTGSSRTGLNEMFRKYRAPLFEQAINLVMPSLGEDFLIDRIEVFRDRTGRHLDMEPVRAVFEQVGFSPAHLNKLLVQLMIAGGTDIQALHAEYAGDAFDDTFPTVWQQLKPMDRALLQLLALGHGSSGLYSLVERQRLAGLLNEASAPSPARVQTSQKRLEKLGLLSPIGEVGRYEIEDPAFAYWLRTHTGRQQRISNEPDERV